MQEKKIKGLVKDQTGELLPGATVRVKGKSTLGTVTDINGHFELKAENKDIIIVSYVGYENKEVIAEGDFIEIILEKSSTYIDEVVVVAFGTQKKVNLTGSVSFVDGETLKARPVANVSSALQGMIPGLDLSVNQNGGEMNNTMNINIRGAGTIGEGSTSSPLILIDGVPGNLNALNMQDIENISVLKDAAASSIYGSQAPFGVILVTTKQGKQGIARISYSGDLRFTSPLGVPDQMNSLRYAHMYNDAFTNSGFAEKISQERLQAIADYQNGTLKSSTVMNPQTGLWRQGLGANANTDWYDVYFKNYAASQNHALSINGGSEKIKYYLSGSFLGQEGLMRFGDDTFKRYNFNGKVDFNLNPFIKILYNTRFSKSIYNKPSYMNYYFYHQIARRWPTNPVYDPNGYPMEDSDIYRLEEGGREKENIKNDFQQIKLTVTPVQNWNIYVDANMTNILNSAHTDILPVYEYNAAGDPIPVNFNSNVSAGNSQVKEQVAKRETYTVNAYTDYSLKFNDNHNLKLLVGFNAEVSNYEMLSAQRDSLIVPSTPTISTATGKDVVNYKKNSQSTAGFFSRLNYDYKGRYLLEANLRYDGSSRFSRNQRWNLFPSFSVGWNIAREAFWKEHLEQIINTFKIRGSWGELGNQNTKSLYPFYSILPFQKEGNANNEWLLNGKLSNFVGMPSLISSSLTWERIRTLNLGIDFGLFSNQLTGSIEYFNRSTFDMVGPAPALPGVLGTTPPLTNNADMESKGFELELNWKNKIGDFNYSVRGTLSNSIQKITSYPNATGNIYNYYKGKILGEIWGYETAGIAKTDEEMNTHLNRVGGQDAIGNNWAAGDIMYADLDGKPGIDAGSNTLSNHGDLKKIGNSTPRYRYGITVDAFWKGFDFTMFWQGIGKRDYSFGVQNDKQYQQVANFWGIVGNSAQCVGFENHWNYFRPEGHPMGANLNSYYPRPYVESDKNHRHQTHYLLNAAYLRLKNIQLGYVIPEKITNAIGISRLRIYISGENLLTFTKFPDMFDPETLEGIWGAGKTYPLSKTFSLGVNVNF